MLDQCDQEAWATNYSSSHVSFLYIAQQAMRQTVALSQYLFVTFCAVTAVCATMVERLQFFFFLVSLSLST